METDHQLAVQANAGHTTSTLIGGWVRVQQLVGSVSVRLDGVDVLVVGVVGVHDHSQLTTLGGREGSGGSARTSRAGRE